MTTIARLRTGLKASLAAIAICAVGVIVALVMTTRANDAFTARVAASGLSSRLQSVSVETRALDPRGTWETLLTAFTRTGALATIVAIVLGVVIWRTLKRSATQ